MSAEESKTWQVMQVQTDRESFRPFRFHVKFYFHIAFFCKALEVPDLIGFDTISSWRRVKRFFLGLCWAMFTVVLDKLAPQR